MMSIAGLYQIVKSGKWDDLDKYVKTTDICFSINDIINIKGRNLLHLAVKQRRLDIVKILVNDYHIDNIPDTLGIYPLHIVCMIPHKYSEQEELTNSSLNDICGYISFLSYEQKISILNNYLNKFDVIIEMAKLICKYYPDDINVRINNDKFGRMPLHYAIEFGSLSLVKLLISYNSSVNELFFDRYTNSVLSCLDLAVMYNKRTIRDYLISLNAKHAVDLNNDGKISVT